MTTTHTTDRGTRKFASRLLMTSYGLIAYALFLLVFLYAIGWVERLVVPRTIDEGSRTPAGIAVFVNLALLSLFAVQHSVMARPWFKKRWTRIVPAAIERSTYVLLATAALALVMWQWRPLPQQIWDVQAPALRVALYAVSLAGFGLVLTSTYAIDHFDLFGLRQVFRNLRGQRPPETAFRTPWLYRIVRHPLYLGFVVAFWVTPTMTVGHLLFAAVTTAYIVVAVQFEEHDLIATFGDRYRSYRARVPMLVPGLPVSRR
ncbi:methanethiol S-methyltransferase [Rhodococcus chondri]|uniref:methanethiol S-methyltransferase n=1 Tax=Rhodococcus chondri TaxID=3065941 RepID=A0ABU7JVQ5_9NOCA|nr:methanethiol S-methyltransferase [Rhodococcus sp. CC-R104]MEE2034111.1 isoprenylcysteine carboxylmethyltransferase family protein [Rhodococcus sp. CC-R104]